MACKSIGGNILVKATEPNGVDWQFLIVWACASLNHLIG